MWSLPHTHPPPNHGLYLCLSVFPVPPILWECLVGHPRVHPLLSSTNGEDDQIQDFPGLLPSCHRTYSCIHCRAHLANHNELISKSFQGSQGQAYLFNSVVNVGCRLAEEHVLLTGLHAIAFTVKTAKPPWAGNMNMHLKATRNIKANTSLS